MLFHGSSTNKKSSHPIRTSLNRQKRHRRGPLVVNTFVIGILFVVLALLLIVVVIKSVLSLVYQNNNDTPTAITTHSTNTIVLENIRHEFQERYGKYADTVLQKGVRTFGSTRRTAQRLARAAAHRRPFVMSFAGYSVTVGRGNYFSQSFPFVVERILQQPMQSLFNVSLTVRNAAIGGIPSFPYGFCLAHFLGEDADVVSWDYGMNEGRGSAILESYLRHSLLLPKKPMMILLDNNPERTKLLEEYTSRNILPDAIQVQRANDVLDFNPSTLSQNNAPRGFQEWDKFGAGDGCPGRSSWHPKKQEHELIGWIIAMHMVHAMELAHAMMQEPNWQERSYSRDDFNPVLPYPPPINKNKLPKNDDSVTQLLYGYKDGNEYNMKETSCRTSFLPAVDDSKVLPSIVVSGLAGTDLDMMQERPNELYKRGWVLDVSKVERNTKKKVEQCGGLGYIDMKVALYGIPESGTLRLWLSSNDNGVGEEARDFFDSLVICEANENREKDACQLNEDMQYIVGGERVAPKDISYIAGAGEYLKRKTCVSVGIPDNAKITRLGNVETIGGDLLSDNDKRRLGGSVETDDDEVGLLVDITAGPRVSREKGACCVSHVIWEKH
jgi:hypothetical protein